ncbi:hypothetical protein KBD61_02765 [Patescibacteria group bacterium]|nr:hypothetical protein [Patescibacteria group bacterium]MBP9709925.1 hypothetical protein [Patescibacteria group bacterium]
MFITTHALLGVLLGEQFASSPVLAFGLGLVSHFVADIIPHGDSGLYKDYASGTKMKRAIAYVTLDGLVGMLLVLALFNTGLNTHRLAITAGIFGSVLPDVLVALYQVFHIKVLEPVNRFHFSFHTRITDKKGDIPFGAGVALQVFLTILLLIRIW